MMTRLFFSAAVVAVVLMSSGTGKCAEELDVEVVSLGEMDAAPLTEKDALALMAAAKLDIVAEGELKIDIQHKAVAGANPDDPNGAIISLAARLKFAAQAEPVVHRLTASTIDSTDWKLWECPHDSRMRGQVLALVGKQAGKPMSFYARPAPAGSSNRTTAAKNSSAFESDSIPKATTSSNTSSNTSINTSSNSSNTSNNSSKEFSSFEAGSDSAFDVGSSPFASDITDITSSDVAFIDFDTSSDGESASGSDSEAASYPKAGMFDKLCAQEFTKYLAVEYLNAAKQVFSQIENDDGFYLPFRGKVKYECEPPKGMNWQSLASRVHENGCLPCYQRSPHKEAQIGNDVPPTRCHHQDEMSIRNVHPKWSVSHSLQLSSDLKDPQNMMAWGKRHDPERHGTCNYVGCADPGRIELGSSGAEEHSSRASQAQIKKAEQSADADLGSGMVNSATAQAGSVWSCGTNTAVKASTAVTPGGTNFTVSATPTTDAQALGFSAECAAELLSHMRDKLSETANSFISSMQSTSNFVSQSGWDGVAKQLVSCACNSHYDQDVKGGKCRMWDDDGQSWCYVYKGCMAPGAEIVPGKPGMKKLMGCCGDTLNNSSQCSVFAKEGRCTSGGDSGIGAEVAEQCHKTCGVCKSYV